MTVLDADAFLTQLTRILESSKTAGTVYVTMKRCAYLTAPIQRACRPFLTAMRSSVMPQTSHPRAKGRPTQTESHDAWCVLSVPNAKSLRWSLPRTTEGSCSRMETS